MNYYRFEKKQLKSFAFYASLIFWNFFCFLSVSSKIASYTEGTATAIEFGFFLPFVGLCCTLALLNSALFFQKEQSEVVFLPDKYRMVAADLQKMVRIKFLLLFRGLLIYLVCCIAIYYISIFGRFQWKADFSAALPEIFTLLVGGLIFTAGLTVHDLIWMRRGRL